MIFVSFHFAENVVSLGNTTALLCSEISSKCGEKAGGNLRIKSWSYCFYLKGCL